MNNNANLIKKELKEFIENDLNENNTCNNCNLYLNNFTKCIIAFDVEFNRNHKELYIRLANKVIEMGGVITETCLCTYKTTIAFFI